MKLLSAGHVLTMNSSLDYIQDGAVLVKGQVIQAIGKREDLL